MSFLRNPAALFALNLTTLVGVVGSTYNLRSHMVELSEDHEARMVRGKFISLGLAMLSLNPGKAGCSEASITLEDTHHPVQGIVCSWHNLRLSNQLSV